MRLLHGRNNLTAAAAELFPIRCAPHLLIAARNNSLVLASLSQFDEHPTDRRWWALKYYKVAKASSRIESPEKLCSSIHTSVSEAVNQQRAESKQRIKILMTDTDRRVLKESINHSS